MVQAHVIDAWTRDSDRPGAPFAVAVFIAGLGAPLFMFLAGAALPMAGSLRASSIGHRAAAAAARLRGWQVFALAFLFRLQAQLLGWGPLVNFLKVDILNVMGLALVMAGFLWGLSSSRTVRIVLFAVATGVFAMGTPLIQQAAWVGALPDPVEWYFRPTQGHTSFVLFPWAGFLFAGAIFGELVDAYRTGANDRGLQLIFACVAVLTIAAGYWSSFQPSIYPVSNFWLNSPTFFFIRLGLVMAMVPVTWALEKTVRPLRFLDTLGRSSLFVYWIHVEMVYGIIAKPLERLLPLEISMLGVVALCALLLVIVRWKNQLVRDWQLTGPLRILAPVLR
jgi:fucose 4-O-acetylase-like acetyltransferase